MKRRLSILLVVAATAASALSAVPMSAHTFLNYCPSFSNDPLLNIFENEGYGGATDYACSDDGSWGDSSGYIRGFHDRMTSYHIRSSGNVIYGNCVRFYEHEWSGAFFDAYSFTGSFAHIVNSNVGATWNDRVDSHIMGVIPAQGGCIW